MLGVWVKSDQFGFGQVKFGLEFEPSLGMGVNSNAIEASGRDTV